ncbi:MAG: NHL repeat-containing protein [Coriobacteriia bacterium]|nr:NHL repeat-containing protein [Coriobacteriia bacterium]
MSRTENSPNASPEHREVTEGEAQRRVEEILAERGPGVGDDRDRRTRAILIVVLVILLLLLCGIGAFLYRLLVPSPDSGPTAREGDSDTAGVTWIRSIYGFGPSADQLFTNPNDAATAPDGVIWVTDPGNARVVGFRGDGTFVDLIQGSKQTGEPFRLPSRIAVDPDGIIYVVDRANEALTIMDGETKLASQNIPGLTAVAVDDQIVVVGSTAGFAILDKDGNAQSVVGTKGTSDEQFDTVGGVAIDSRTDTIYVVDTYNNRLSAWDFSGARRWIVTLGNPANKVRLEGGMSLETSISAPAALQLPTDVTVDGKGRPIVLDAFDFSISAFSPADGEFAGKAGTHGQRDGQFMYPTGFDYDVTKDWFTVADTQNLRAQIVRIDGTGAEGAAALSSWLSRLMSGPARALWPCLGLLPLLLVLALVRRRRRIREAREARELAAQHGFDVDSV